MKIKLTTLSDMGASRIEKMLKSTVLNRQSNARMGTVREHTTRSGLIEARAILDIPTRENFDRVREWFMESIRYTYRGPGFVLLIDLLDDGASLDPVEIIDEEVVVPDFSYIYGARQRGTLS